MDTNLFNLNEEIFQKINLLREIIKNLRKQRFQDILELKGTELYHVLDRDVQRFIQDSLPQIIKILEYKESITSKSSQQKMMEIEKKQRNIYGFDKQGINPTLEEQ